MPPNIGFASMQVIPSLRGMDAAMRSQVVGLGRDAGGVASSNFGTSMDRGLSQSIGKTGGTLTRTLTPAAAAVGLIGKRMFDQFDTGLDAIRTGTGATGEALNALGGSFKRVSGRVTAPLGEVGEVLADLQTRTGQTGGSLETLTQRTLELGRIQSTGPLVLSEKLTRVFGDWSVATEDQTGAMDKLFRASQATGPPVAQLSDLVVRFGAPLRQFGFGLDQSAALLGKFEKEGVNTELVMGSLRQGLGKLARAGEKDIPAAFTRIVEEIQNAGSAGEANARAMEIFGARAGPDMAAAIQEGRFELGELFAQVTDGSDTIAQANKDTLSLGDRFTMLKNRVTGVLGPFGEVIGVFGGVAAAIGPVLLGVSQIGPGLEAIGPKVAPLVARFRSLLLTAGPIVLIGAAIAGLGFLIFKFRDQIGAALGAVGRFFQRTFGGAARFLAKWGPFVLPLILGPIGVIALVFIKFRKQAMAVFGAVGRVFNTLLVQPIKWVWRNVLQPVFRLIGAIWVSTRESWKMAINGLMSFFRGAWDRITSIVLTAGIRILQGIKFLADGMGKVTNILGKIPGLGKLVPDVAAAGALIGDWITKLEGLRSGGTDLGRALSADRNFHRGGVVRGPGPGEVLAVLEVGERVLSRQQAKAYDERLRTQAQALAPLSVGAADGGERSIATQPRQLVLQVSGRFETPGQIIDAADWQRRVSGWD